jgi:MFS family permease
VLRAAIRSPAFVVGALSLAYLLAMIDRLVFSLLIEPIKADLGLTDAQMGSLAGLAFGLFYTLMGVPIGRLADRVHRPALVAAGVVLWSAATMACGFATSFARLFLMRVFVGVGEASISPAAYSLIAQVVPRERLGRALSVYMLGTVVGLGVAWIAGGQVLHWLAGGGAPVLPFLGSLGPWQMVFLIVGLPGLVVGPLLLLIHDPRQEGARSAPRGTWGGLWEQLRRGKRVYAAHFAGVAAVNTYGYALVTWAPAMFRRDFGWSMQQTGLVLGTGILLAGGAGMLGSGHLADALTRRGFADATFRILFFGTLLMAPVGICGPRIGGGAARAALFVTPAMGLFFAVVACAPTALQLVTPANLRASVSSVYLFVVNLVAFALGPLSVGWLSDRVGVDEGGLALALMILAAACLPIGALAFGFGMAPFRRALPAPSVTTS